jgi:formyl-CoA transferase
VFPTSDGHINIAASGQNLFERACEALEAAHLVSDPRYATGPLRSENRKVLTEQLSAITRTKPGAHWIALLNKAGVPCGPINSIDQTFAEPQVKHLGIARRVRHRKLGELRVVGQPINMSRYPQPEELKPTPELGEHTADVLREVGYDAAQIEKLKAGGVI